MPEQAPQQKKHPCGGCAARRAALLAKQASVNKSRALRKGCPNCTRKHLACAWIVAEHLKDKPTPMSASELVARAEILWSESRHGYPSHLWMAIGCLAIASHAYDVRRIAPDADQVKKLQKLIEEKPDTWNPEWVANLKDAGSIPSQMMVAAHLAEAESECCELFPEVAAKIMATKQKFTQDRVLPANLIELIEEVTAEEAKRAGAFKENKPEPAKK